MKKLAHICSKKGELRFSRLLKNFVEKYPVLPIRVDKKTGKVIQKDQEIETKKVEEVNYTSKFKINIDGLPDYQIIGAEIFRSSLKDIYDDGKNNLEKISKEQLENELYSPKVGELEYPEPHKYNKYLTSRPLYRQAIPKYTHIFTPSYRHKVEPLNSLHLFRWSYFNSDRKLHNELMLRRSNYIQGFMPPFELHDFDIENLLKQFLFLKEKFKLDFNSKDFQNTVNDMYNKPEESSEGIKNYSSLIDLLVDKIPHLNHKLYPNLLMRLFLDLGLNSKKVWIAIEQEIMNNLHHYNMPEICQINYVVTISSPKFTSSHFRNILLQTALNRVEEKNLSLNDIFSVCMGYRMNKNKILYDKIVDNFLNRKKEFITDSDNNTPSILSKIFHSWSNNKPKEYGPRTLIPQKELIEKFIDTYEEDLNNNILKMNAEDISRLTTSLYLLKNDNIDTFLNRIERNLIKIKTTHPEKLEPFIIHSVIRAFSKMKNGKMCGSDKFFNEMEPIILNHIENFKFSLQELSDILYAYSVRSSGSEIFYKMIEKKINEDINQANNFHIVHNILWHYLFIENRNLEQWRSLMRKSNELEGRLPIYYYRPFKIAGAYMDNGFNEEEKGKIGKDTIFEFKDRFFDPEQIYDYVKNEDLHENQEYQSLKGILNTRLGLFPLTHVIYDNCFIVHFCWEAQKMGINVWIDRDKISKTTNQIRINRQCYLHSKMLKYQGWEILDLIWEDFANLGDQNDRDKYLHNWYYSTSMSQEKKGIYKKRQKIV